MGRDGMGMTAVGYRCYSITIQYSTVNQYEKLWYCIGVSVSVSVSVSATSVSVRRKDSDF